MCNIPQAAPLAAMKALLRDLENTKLIYPDQASCARVELQLHDPVWNIVYQIQREKVRIIRRLIQRLRLPCQQILLMHLSYSYTSGES